MQGLNEILFHDALESQRPDGGGLRRHFLGGLPQPLKMSGNLYADVAISNLRSSNCYGGFAANKAGGGVVVEGERSKGVAGQKRLDKGRDALYLTSRLNTMTDSLSSTLSALADPTRRAILARLSLGAVSVTELAEPFAMSLPAVSKHLKVLEHAGLITRGRSAQWRPCQLHAGPLKEVAEWVEEYRRFWAESFARLDDYLQELQAEEKKKEKKNVRKK